MKRASDWPDMSTETYHQHRPDAVVGIITTQPPRPMSPTDCELLDGRQAGLRAASFFRLFPITFPQREVRLIGKLSEIGPDVCPACVKAGLSGE